MGAASDTAPYFYPPSDIGTLTKDCGSIGISILLSSHVDIRFS